MCLLIVKPEGMDVEVESLRNGFLRNRDGGGYAYVDDDGEITVRKGLMKWPDWLAAYEMDVERRGDNSPFLIHFRIGTHGKDDVGNTHPHWIHKKLVMGHNGIIKTPYVKDEPRSDTRIFIDDTLRFLPRGWLKNPGIVDLVAERIGWSKLAFLTTGAEYNGENVFIVNESLGHWNGGVWYSNDTYEKARPAKATTKGGGKWQGKSSTHDTEAIEDWWARNAPPVSATPIVIDRTPSPTSEPRGGARPFWRRQQDRLKEALLP